MGRFDKGDRVIRLFGLDEKSFKESLKALPYEKEIAGEYFPGLLEGKIRIETGRCRNERTQNSPEDPVERFRDLFRPFIYTTEDESMEEVVGNMLSKRGMKISVAESCSGGLISHRLTNIPGSSDYFLGGVVVYSNQSKIGLLNVPPETIDRHGAVSSMTVLAMARNVRKRFGSHMGLAVTGIAGPDGGSREKPVGTVYIGLSLEKDIFSNRYYFSGTREQVKQQTSTMALDWVRRYLNGDPFIPGI